MILYPFVNTPSMGSSGRKRRGAPSILGSHDATLASGYCAATGLSPEEVTREIAALIACAFRPLAYVPDTGGKAERVRYDAVWAAKTAGVAAREGNLAYDDCLHRVSLSTVCALYVSCFARENKDGDKVRYPADAGNDAAIEARMEELEQAFLAAKRG